MAEVKLWYDQEGDFLEVTFADDPAFLEEIEDDVFERRTTDGRIVGFAVMNFSRHNRDNLRLPFALTAVTNG